MSAGQAAEAVEFIYARHRRIDDPHLGEMGSDPADVLVYLRKHGHRMPDGVRVEDLQDAAVLHLWLWWQAADRERWLFDQVVRLGMDRQSFAAVFGVTTRQGFADRRDRLHQLLDVGGAGRPDEQAARRDRAVAEPVGEDAWLQAARERVLQLSAELLEFEPQLDDGAVEYLPPVRFHLAEGRCTVASLTELGWAVEAALDGTRDGNAWGGLRLLAERYAALQAERQQAAAREAAALA